RPLGADAGDLVAQLDKEADGTIRRALLLSLGEYELAQLPSAAKAGWIAKMARIYQDDADAGIHGAAEWLLRQWQQQATIKQHTDAWVHDGKRRARQEAQVRQEL